MDRLRELILETQRDIRDAKALAREYRHTGDWGGYLGARSNVKALRRRLNELWSEARDRGGRHLPER